MAVGSEAYRRWWLITTLKIAQRGLVWMKLWTFWVVGLTGDRVRRRLRKKVGKYVGWGRRM